MLGCKGKTLRDRHVKHGRSYEPKRVAIDVTKSRYIEINKSSFRAKYPTFNETVRAALDIVLAIEQGDKVLLDISPYLRERIESSNIRQMCPTFDACLSAILIKYIQTKSNMISKSIQAEPAPSSEAFNKNKTEN